MPHILAMTNITLSIDDDVYKKMRRYSEVRWSDFVRRTIKKRIEELETLDKSINKERILNMLASENVLKEDWDNKVDEAWDNV